MKIREKTDCIDYGGNYGIWIVADECAGGKFV